MAKVMAKMTGKNSTRGASPTDKSVIENARSVLATEIASLQALHDSLGASFCEAVALLGTTNGRVITTGMGKSGHIARKIAATFSSTGTPALYVHPAEAGHGDLGMIAKGDSVLALSNSGETAELSSIVEYARRIGTALIAITAAPDSSLAKNATIALTLPSFEEACPLGLAPTTSTTLQLALGDALAVALLKWRGFNADDFHSLHPSGSLGRLLMRVDALMHGADKVPLASRDTPMSDCLLKMTESGFGCVGITDAGGALIGVITDGDLRRHMSPDILSKSAEEIMSENPKTVALGTLAGEALLRMETERISAVFVMENDKPVGFIRLLDLLQHKVA